MPKNTSLNKTNTHRASPFEKPGKTIEGALHTLEGSQIDDPVLEDLMSRIGELKRSEQRRFMVRYRKYNERKTGKVTKSGTSPAVRQIGRRFPGVQSLITRNSMGNEVNEVNEVNDDSEDTPVTINTRKSGPTTVRRSSRLRKKDHNSDNIDNEIVYSGDSTTPTRPRRAKVVSFAELPEPIHQNPFQKSNDDLDYDPDDLDYDPDAPIFEDYIDDAESIELGSQDSDLNSDSNSDPNSDFNSDIEIGIDEELNELHDDVPYTSRKRKREIDGLDCTERANLHSTLRQIRESYESRKVDIAKVIQSNFNEEDNAWFYSRLGRIKNMEGKERYSLEDDIQRKFATLTSLQTSGLYEKFNRPAERNIIKEILDSSKSDSSKQIMINRMMSVQNDGGEEYQKALAWLDVVMSIPTSCKNLIGSDARTLEEAEADFGSVLFRLKQNLDSNLFGMENVKRQIMQAVTTIHSDPDSQGYIIALVGDPGVGKTTISSQIAETIGMGFGQVPCGSISDRSVVIGHSSTYIGSYPGVFTQLLIRTGQLNNVVLLDELDKLPDKSLLPTLLQILDREQNFRFKDAFCPEIDIDMSKNLYIIAVNDINCFDKALRDRMKVIYVDGYDTDQKTQICYNHIIPKIQSKTGITPNIDYDTIRYFVNKVSPAISGVRDITRYFEDIYEKLQLIHRFTEYLKHDSEAWGMALSSVEAGDRPTKRMRKTPNRRNRNRNKNAPRDEDAMAIKFREVLKLHLNFDIPPGIDLRDVNNLEFLDVELIESLEG